MTRSLAIAIMAFSYWIGGCQNYPTVGQGNGGAAGAPADAGTCTVVPPPTYERPAAEVRSTATGANGTFTDRCDENGNLVEYLCETRFYCPPGPLPVCFQQPGEAVISRTLDCRGHCVEGTCAARCPAYDDVVIYRSVDRTSGDATLQNQTDQRLYACKLVPTTPSVAYDCRLDPEIGLRMTITRLSGWTSSCAGGPLARVGVTPTNVSLPPEQSACEYDCEIP